MNDIIVNAIKKTDKVTISTKWEVIIPLYFDYNDDTQKRQIDNALRLYNDLPTFENLKKASYYIKQIQPIMQWKKFLIIEQNNQAYISIVFTSKYGEKNTLKELHNIFPKNYVKFIL